MCAIEGAPYLIRCAVSGTKLRRNWYESAPYLVQSARAHTPHTPMPLARYWRAPPMAQQIGQRDDR